MKVFDWLEIPGNLPEPPAWMEGLTVDWWEGKTNRIDYIIRTSENLFHWQGQLWEFMDMGLRAYHPTDGRAVGFEMSDALRYDSAREIWRLSDSKAHHDSILHIDIKPKSGPRAMFLGGAVAFDGDGWTHPPQDGESFEGPKNMKGCYRIEMRPRLPMVFRELQHVYFSRDDNVRPDGTRALYKHFMVSGSFFKKNQTTFKNLYISYPTLIFGLRKFHPDNKIALCYSQYGYSVEPARSDSGFPKDMGKENQKYPLPRNGLRAAYPPDFDERKRAIEIMLLNNMVPYR